MTELWAFLHILSAAVFLLFHGVQVWALFSLAPAFPDREKIFDRAEQSRMAGTPMYVWLGLLVLFGVIAGITGGSFSDGWWLWASIVVLLATVGTMSATAAPFMRTVREATTRWADGTYPMPDAELEALLRGAKPKLIAAIGIAGLAILLWLMVYKPGA
jgi:hypothetical protein